MAVELKPLPMAEAQAFWRDKVQVSPKEFNRMSSEAQVRAFAVSGIAKGDELATMYDALQRAIDDGESMGEFKKRIAQIIERRGWTGLRSWRVDNIFRTNIQTAYNVGHYKQLMEDRAILPFWQYSAVNDSRTRPTHLAMDGKTWPADHPTWDRWFPPNGFRCRCSVIGLTKAQVAARGIQVEEEDITHQLIEPIDPGTGNRMPARQMLPDPGFGINPGKSYWGELGETLAERLEGWPDRVASRVLIDLVGGEAFALWLARPEGTFPVGRLSMEDTAAIGARTRTVSLSAETAVKQAERHPELTASEYLQVQETVTRGERIQEDGATIIYILDSPDGYVSVVKSTASGGAVFLVSFRRLSRDEAKRDSEIQRLRRKKEER